MSDVSPFGPAGSATVALPVTAVSARVAVQSGLKNRRVRIYNAGTSDAAIEFGDSTIVAVFPTGATGASMVIPAGAVEVLTIGASNLAAITATGTATLYITPGEGI